MLWKRVVVAVKEVKTVGLNESEVDKLTKELLREAELQASLSFEYILAIRG